ncbi:MAG: IreB family regulatory phosphoprotein [Clostridia bacterium]|nr:IreB family regulatory phosphoprotein [Clostridia bacterium]
MYDPTKWTRKFVIGDDSESDMKSILIDVYKALKEKGYNPVNQIVGYILSEDPTYITTHKDARKLIRRIDRDELLNALVSNYLRDASDSKD